ncbi:MAG: hypothetical protein Hyperionvirus10_6 [Hyperionvirus sp.]|uniref:Uncharacterized protein n=1 Tax=Hyperionvirus sp. TaxID=2487770 RepID=A0A3G5A8S8_9VIRU|nr:MAG: hypothetical protein Hyperionvirus10_6 [Hyperionvirus sp.]
MKYIYSNSCDHCEKIQCSEIMDRSIFNCKCTSNRFNENCDKYFISNPHYCYYDNKNIITLIDGSLGDPFNFLLGVNNTLDLGINSDADSFLIDRSVTLPEMGLLTSNLGSADITFYGDRQSVSGQGTIKIDQVYQSRGFITLVEGKFHINFDYPKLLIKWILDDTTTGPEGEGNEARFIIVQQIRNGFKNINDIITNEETITFYSAPYTIDVMKGDIIFAYNNGDIGVSKNIINIDEVSGEMYLL